MSHICSTNPYQMIRLFIMEQLTNSVERQLCSSDTCPSDSHEVEADDLGLLEQRREQLASRIRLVGLEEKTIIPRVGGAYRLGHGPRYATSNGDNIENVLNLF